MPSDQTMRSLHALACGSSAGCYDDGIIIVQHEGGSWPIQGIELDELEALGWIAIDSGDDANVSDVNLTEAGQYWLNKWIKKQTRKCVAR